MALQANSTIHLTVDKHNLYEICNMLTDELSYSQGRGGSEVTGIAAIDIVENTDGNNISRLQVNLFEKRRGSALDTPYQFKVVRDKNPPDNWTQEYGNAQASQIGMTRREYNQGYWIKHGSDLIVHTGKDCKAETIIFIPKFKNGHGRQKTLFIPLRDSELTAKDYKRLIRICCKAYNNSIEHLNYLEKEAQMYLMTMWLLSKHSSLAGLTFKPINSIARNVLIEMYSSMNIVGAFEISYTNSVTACAQERQLPEKFMQPLRSELKHGITQEEIDIANDYWESTQEGVNESERERYVFIPNKPVITTMPKKAVKEKSQSLMPKKVVSEEVFEFRRIVVVKKQLDDESNNPIDIL